MWGVSVFVRACARAHVRHGRGGRERFNIFPVTYEPVDELLAARLGPCVYQCGCVFLVCLPCDYHGAWGPAASL